MCNLLLGNAEGYLGIEARGRTDDGDTGIGIETVEDTACSYLVCKF